MKTHDSLRPTIGTSSWLWRAAVALLALVALLASIGLARLAWPVAQTPLANPSAPIASSGAVHDGSAYVEYLLRREPIVTAPSAMRNPNRPVIGTGSAYDGASYGAPKAMPDSSVPAAQNRSSYASSTNAEYVEYLTGRPLRSAAQPTVAPNPNTPNIGTGSAYQP